MMNSVKARTPILTLILFVFAIGNAFAETKVVVIPLGADTQKSVAAYDGGGTIYSNISDSTVTASATVEAASSGTIIANSSATVVFKPGVTESACSITTSAEIENDYSQFAGNPDGTTVGNISTTRHFTVNAGSHTVNLVCLTTAGTSTINIYRPQLSLLFIPD